MTDPLTETTRPFLFLGLLAAIIVGLGEYLLHFSPHGPSGEIEMLLDVPLERARLGHFLAIFGVPLYFAGYYGIFRFFRKDSFKWALSLFVIGILSFTYGGIWISSRYFAAVVLQKTSQGPLYEFFLLTYEQNYQVLVWLLRSLVLLLSGCYVICILQSNSLSNWWALLNPIFLLILSISSLFVAKPLGVHIAPIAMNVVHFILFSKLLLLYPQRVPLSS
ncbi:MAG: hypothetical protein P1V97_27035 [Planctomycetota bacterium]|nr:hypothetical protein [Planctomycetota bacterium]